MKQSVSVFDSDSTEMQSRKWLTELIFLSRKWWHYCLQHEIWVFCVSCFSAAETEDHQTIGVAEVFHLVCSTRPVIIEKGFSFVEFLSFADITQKWVGLYNFF
jgi:hypothetical protein